MTSWLDRRRLFRAGRRGVGGNQLTREGRGIEIDEVWTVSERQFYAHNSVFYVCVNMCKHCLSISIDGDDHKGIVPGNIAKYCLQWR